MNNRRRAALFAAVFATGLLGSALAVSAETLSEAIASAYESNPGIRIARGNMRNADEAYFRTRRQNLFPTITASATSNGNRTINTSSSCSLRDSNGDCIAFSSSTRSSQSASAGVSLSQRIYSGGRLTLAIKSAEISLLRQREALRQTEATLVVNVVDAYLAVRSAEESLNIAKASLAAQQQLAREALAQFEEGASTRTDVASADASLASSQASLASTTAQLENAREQYRNVVGHSPENLEAEPSLASLLPKSPGEALQIAKAGNNDMRSVYLDERQAAIAVAQARVERRPTITATLGSTYTPEVFGQPLNTAVTGGLNLNVPIFTGLTTSSSIRSAEESYRLIDVTIEQRQRTLQQQVNQQWNTLQSQRGSIVAQEAGVRASRLAVEGTREELAVQLKTTLEMLTAENNLRSTEQRLVDAKYGEYRTAVGLLNTMGLLEAKTLAPQIQEYDPLPHFEDLNDFELPWEGGLRAIDTIGAPAIPQRVAGPDEVVPTFDENF